MPAPWVTPVRSWDTATWAQPSVLSTSSIAHFGRTREGVSLSVIPLSHQRDESGDGSSLCFASRSRAVLDGYGRELLMSEAGHHIRQEKRKEIHEPFLESKSTGVEHLTSGQLTVYLWMRARCGAVLPRKVCTSAHDSWQVLMCEGQSCSHFRAFTSC